MHFRPCLALLLPLSLAAQVKTFQADTTHTVLGFRAATTLFDVPGRFDRYKLDIVGDPGTLQGARVRLDIDAASIDTANRIRDKHLRSEDFFDVPRFPKITFTGTYVRREGDRVVVRGTLTMHGSTRDLEIPFRATQGVNGAGTPTWSYRASLPLERLDYGLGAESVAAKISLARTVDLDLLLVGSFN
jgi:polyisoprenoid-binding protein YceI